MRKHFLILMLLSLLPLAGWSADVLKVGDYEFTVNSKFVQVGDQFEIQSITPESASYEPGAIYDTEGNTVPELTKVGSYFQQVTVTEAGDVKSVFVPFMVVKSGADYFQTDYIWNQTTFDASVGNLEDSSEPHGVLHYYYKIQWPYVAGRDDYDPYTHEPSWNIIGTQSNWRALMFPQIAFMVKGLDRQGNDFDAWEKYAVYATYKVEKEPGVYETRGTYTQLDEGKPALLPRGGYWMISIPEMYNGKYPIASGGDNVDGLHIGQGYVLNYDNDGNTTLPSGDALTETSTINDALEADFNWDYVNLYLAPQAAPFDLTATLGQATGVYSGTEHQVTPTVKRGNEILDNYDIKWYYEGQAVTEIKNAGTYIGVVTAGNDVAIVEYTVTRASDRVVINPAYVEKVYGGKDPDPKFAQDNVTLYPGESIDEQIKPFLVLKRSDDDVAAGGIENVGDHKYYIDFTPEYRAGKCNYDITILQNYSILTITKAPLTINVAPATKQYKGKEPDAFTYEVPLVNGKSQLKFDDEASGKPGADDIITEIARKEGETVGEYAFTAESKNYNVTVNNAFTITASDVVDGIQFAFTDADNLVYTGVAQTPAFTLTDTDLNKALVAGEDYVVEGEGAPVYVDNIDAGTATVTVTLKGNYSGTVTGNFTIKKAPLTIKAMSYTADQETYRFTYEGFVSYPVGENTYTETAENQAERNVTTGDNQVIYFKAPTAPVVTKGQMIETDVYKLVASKVGAEAKNYEFKTEDGLLALNGTTPITVVAQPFTKEYDGEGVTADDLEIKVYDGNNQEITDQTVLDKLVLSSGPIYQIAAATTGTNGNAVATLPNVGVYNITLQGATVTKDYSINWIGANDGCVITPRKITLIAEDKTKVFGAAVPTLTAKVKAAETVEGKTVGGLIGNDTEESIGLVNNGPNNTGYYVSLPTPYSWSRQNGWSITGEHATTAGHEYPITIGLMRNSSNGIFGNYKVQNTTNGKLTVLKAKVTIAAADTVKQFGAADPEYTITVTPETWTVGEVEYTTPASVATVANMEGFWTITRTDKNDENGEKGGAHQTLKVTLTDAGKNATDYDITASTTNGILTIGKAKIKVIAKGQWIYYGADINPYDMTIILPASNKTLIWAKRSVVDGVPQELTQDQEATNQLIMSLGKLSVVTGKDQIGTNYDAYQFTFEDASAENYEIAPDEEVEGQTVYGFTNNTLLVYPLEVIPLDKDMLYDVCPNKTLCEVLNDHQGVKLDVILPARAMKSNDWYAWVLPFQVNQRDFFKEGVWGYGAMETLGKSTATSVSFNLTVQPIEANTPFIVKIDNSISNEKMATITLKGVTIAKMDYLGKNPTSGESGNVQFIGLYEENAKPLDASTRVLRRLPDSTQPMEFWSGEGVTLPRTNAYLQFPTVKAAQEARIFVEEPDGSVTAIDGITTKAEVNANGWYTVNGMKLDAAPAQKGVYIKDGKKVVIK